MSVMKTGGSGSGSISQRHGSADPDPDPHPNVIGKMTRLHALCAGTGAAEHTGGSHQQGRQGNMSNQLYH